MSARRQSVAAALLAFAALPVLATPAGADFRYVTAWGGSGAGNGQFLAPLGIASDDAGAVYVADEVAGRVQRFDENGGFLGGFGSPGAGAGQFAGASHVVASASGSVYVTDRGNARVERFTSDGTFVQAWGSLGAGDGQFQAPAGVASNSRGDVYVVDSSTNRVQRFTADGAFDFAWGGTGGGPGLFASAQDIAVDVFGDVYVLDTGANRVEKFSGDGMPLFGWGSAGAGEGQFNGPTGIGSDAAGNVYVADTGNRRVQQFTSDGAFLASFGNTGGEGQLARPVDVAADAGGTAYVVDADTSRVLKFSEPAPPLPPPEAGRTANIKPVSGTVRVRRAGTKQFVRLRKPRQIAIGSEVDTLEGRARLITASDLRGGQQAAVFRAGRFVVGQRRVAHPVTDIVLTGGDFSVCSRDASRVAFAAGGRKKKLRQIWAGGHGRFKTKGHDASGAPRGTIWLMVDRCDGTLVRVRRGTVEVRDFGLRRTVTVRAGHSYLARRR